jgi:hypothetical protein
MQLKHNRALNHGKVGLLQATPAAVALVDDVRGGRRNVVMEPSRTLENLTSSPLN